MLKRNGDCTEMSCNVADVINDLIASRKDDVNNVHNILLSSLNEDEKVYAKENSLSSLIYEVANVSSSVYKENFTLDEEKLKELVREVMNISDALGSNTSFTKHLEKMIKKSEFFRRVEDEFTTTRENILSIMKKCDEKDVAFAKTYYENLFSICISQITSEFYFILKKADILTLISRYNENDREINLDLTFKVVNPLCAVLETLLIEEKSNFFDLFVKYFK